VATSRKIVKTGTSVSCPTCSYEIPLRSTPRLPREVSVLCPNCSRRNIHRAAAVHDQKQDAETTNISRTIQFGRKAKTSIQPKSRLYEWASRLLP
jgi:predicted RNA-binding Zn-ribbon protein involved in translation (DUF1610 family)